MTPEDLTFADRNRLRQMLDAEDQRASGGMKSFDLNKPPTPPYAYREYPSMMFGSDGQTCAARNSQEREWLRSQGWRDEPAAAKPHYSESPGSSPAEDQRQEPILRQILQTLERVQMQVEHQYNSIRDLEARQAGLEAGATKTEDPEPPPKTPPPTKKNPPPPTKKRPGSAQ